MIRSGVVAATLITIFFCGCGGTSPQVETKMPAQPTQKVVTLTQPDQQRLRDQRAIVEKFVTNEGSRQRYQTAAGKVQTIQAILQQGAFKPSETYELQCLGVVLGDAFVQDLKMEWVMVEDDQGRDPAVRLPGTSLILFPLTMISKRVERGENVDVIDLFNQTATQVDEFRRGGA
jgi:hypothetical protein